MGVKTVCRQQQRRRTRRRRRRTIRRESVTSSSHRLLKAVRCRPGCIAPLVAARARYIYIYMIIILRYITDEPVTGRVHRRRVRRIYACRYGRFVGFSPARISSPPCLSNLSLYTISFLDFRLRGAAHNIYSTHTRDDDVHR